jgi:phosphatidylserine/phosphatidylglycerophosphate/cardiolipin synthase-like enzyme
MMAVTVLLALTLAAQAGAQLVTPSPQAPHLTTLAVRAPAPPPVSDLVYFSPPLAGQAQTAEAAIVQAIGAARSSVLVQAYSFTSVPIAEALVAARRRGVAEVEAILDPTDLSARNPVPEQLAAGDVGLAVDHAHAIAHNKIIIIDRTTVIQGSYNFTASALHHNAENIRIRYRDPCAELFVRNWQFHRTEAKTLTLKPPD